LNEDHIVVAGGSREMYKLSTTYIFIGRPPLLLYSVLMTRICESIAQHIV